MVFAVLFSDSGEKFPCPCCGYRVNRMQPGCHEICPICGWEDDLSQLRFINMPGSSNHVSLRKAQINYATFGASEKRKLMDVREANEIDSRDKDWRPVDPDRDNIEEPRSGINYVSSYPQDPTVMYYWRSYYWRRISG